MPDAPTIILPQFRREADLALGLSAIESRLASRPYIQKCDGWDKAWLAAKANYLNVPAKYIILGHSFAWGSQASDTINKSWAGLVRAQLVAKYGSWGDFYPTTLSTWGSWGTGFNGPTVWNVTATGQTPAWYGYVISNYYAATPVAALVFTSPTAFTSCDIVYADRGVATPAFQFQIDGGASTQVNTADAAAGGYLHKVTVTGLSNAVHTISFDSLSSNRMAIVGVSCYSGSVGGIGAANCSLPASLAHDWTKNVNTGFADPISNLSGRTSAAAMTGFGFPSQPSLAIISFGTNECQNGAGVNSFSHALRRFCQALRRGTKDCSILMTIDANPDADSSDAGTPFVNPQNYHLFVEKILAIATEFNATILNMHAKWGETAIADGVQSGHPTDAGYADYAANIAALIV